MNLQNRSILVCVCGGIAAYKVCDVVSKLAQGKGNVTVVMTAEAQKFVGATTFQALTANPVYTDLWQALEGKDPQHIRLAQKADLILVAPCTANMMAKMASGLADELVSTILLASDPRKVVIAPSMNEGMWIHPATQRNAKRLRLGVPHRDVDAGHRFHDHAPAPAFIGLCHASLQRRPAA